MQKLIREYSDDWSSLHPVVRATLLHGEFVKIHPFIRLVAELVMESEELWLSVLE